MRITKITVYRIELPYVGGSYGWAKGYSLSLADSTVVRLDTDEGLSGWGETCPLGAVYLPAYPEGVRLDYDGPCEGDIDPAYCVVETECETAFSVLYVDADGPLPRDLRTLDFRKIERPKWPFDG